MDCPSVTPLLDSSLFIPNNQYQASNVAQSISPNFATPGKNALEMHKTSIQSNPSPCPSCA